MDYFQLDNIIISICFIYCVVLIVHYTVGKGIYYSQVEVNLFCAAKAQKWLIDCFTAHKHRKAIIVPRNVAK